MPSCSSDRCWRLRSKLSRSPANCRWLSCCTRVRSCSADGWSLLPCGLLLGPAGRNGETMLMKLCEEFEADRLRGVGRNGCHFDVATENVAAAEGEFLEDRAQALLAHMTAL